MTNVRRKLKHGLDEKDILIAARTIIQNTGWCQRQYAKNKGKPIYSGLTDPDYLHLAEQYSLDGAIIKARTAFWLALEPYPNTPNSIRYNVLASSANQMIVDVCGWKGKKSVNGRNDIGASLGELNDQPEITAERAIDLLNAAIDSLEHNDELLETGWRRMVILTARGQVCSDYCGYHCENCREKR